MWRKRKKPKRRLLPPHRPLVPRYRCPECLRGHKRHPDLSLTQAGDLVACRRCYAVLVYEYIPGPNMPGFAPGLRLARATLAECLDDGDELARVIILSRRAQRWG
jgi:hypothetical protein